MINTKALIGVIALSALAAACSGASDEGDSENAEPAAASAPAGAPAADDVTTTDGTILAKFTADAAAGKTVFAQCRSCHVTDPGINKIGPSLAGLIGRKAGTVPGFNYSPADKGSAIVWTKEKLFQFLENPKRVVPGTKMVFGGIADAQKRADLIAYLENPT